ncbi:trypsin-like peptidase domain-containing protein [Ruthenibacterium sp. CLA-JM-H11]|uniref:Trypsin-like peptidase domain-containing protein n=1 Tax=Ruthenibacterium intestinale TaxID=3133163 RepID=A0ABV1GIR9_9FIRM
MMEQPNGSWQDPRRDGWQPPQYEYVPRPAPKRGRAPLIITLLCLALAAVVLVSAAAVLLWQGKDPFRIGEQAPAGAGEDAPAFELQELPEDMDDGLPTTQIAQQVGPSVVCINVYMPQSLSVAAYGSGVILNEEGFIVTNAHVVEDSSDLSVILNDGREFSARIIGQDTQSDLAVIKIEAEDLVPATFGNSDTLQVGERTVVIGNAAGRLAGTVTQGIVSGLNRQVPIQMSDGSVITMNLIQTDAAINPGNSGGAVVNRYGQVIGISSAKLSGSDYEGLCFAIPISDAQPVVQNLIAYGYVKDRMTLGVTVIALSSVTGPERGLPAHGLYIAEVLPESDLVNHDVTAGDVILKADGRELTATADLQEILKEKKSGDTIDLQIYKHSNGKTVAITANLLESTP